MEVMALTVLVNAALAGLYQKNLKDRWSFNRRSWTILEDVKNGLHL